MTYTTKDSGARVEFASGMVRDTDDGKARFDLLVPLDVPYAEQLLTRCAELMARGAVKYGERNFEQASTLEEWRRARSSALRHLMQWMCGEDDEDHAAATVFNLLAAETIAWKLEAD